MNQRSEHAFRLPNLIELLIALALAGCTGSESTAEKSVCTQLGQSNCSGQVSAGQCATRLQEASEKNCTSSFTALVQCQLEACGDSSKSCGEEASRYQGCLGEQPGTPDNPSDASDSVDGDDSSQPKDSSNTKNDTAGQSDSSGCKSEYPKGQPPTQPCCPAWGIDACGAGHLCAALDGRQQPVCYEEESRKVGESCTEDSLCGGAADQCYEGTCIAENSKELEESCQTTAQCKDRLTCRDGVCRDRCSIIDDTCSRFALVCELIGNNEACETDLKTATDCLVEACPAGEDPQTACEESLTAAEECIGQ